MEPDELERIEIELLLEGVYRVRGLDFRNYVYASLRRRVWHRVHAEDLVTVSALQDKVFRSEGCMDRLISDLVIHVTEMFRDPEVFRQFREEVVPVLRDLPFLRIWHAGCSTGEEAYSMAILLHEEGLYDRTRIYATDLNEAVLNKAKEGVYPLDKMKMYTQNYVKSGGKASFSDYYTARYHSIIFPSFLKKNIVFAQHNLVTDTSFHEFDVIFCRNVMIYFNRNLQNRVQSLFHQSLSDRGFLVLGSKETLHFSPYSDHYEAYSQTHKIYRKETPKVNTN
ncbi:CheR family methyltransferase [Marinicrinis sediminis]|uniref:CheR family methyltransferase n=1 Tax=Marinicrinis sediminis TaxID=1652465 RepID=A0ABW5R891_9BACL